MKYLSGKLKEWVENNEFYCGGVLTNELKFNQKFGQNIQKLTVELEYHNQNIIAKQILETKNRFLNRCRKIDQVCRKGCRTEEEFFELDFIRSRAVGLGREMAELFEMVEKCQKSEVRIQTSDADEWITVTAAAELLAVSRGTVSKWTTENIIENNSKTGHHRRLLKSSVLMLKQQIEDGYRIKDEEDLRKDDPRF